MPQNEGATKGWLRALKLSAVVEAQTDRTLGMVVAEEARRRPDADALISETVSLTYGELSGRIARWGRWALARGLPRGRTVALVMTNCPEYLAIWLGIISVGGVVALINTSLKGASLAHCLAVADPEWVIVEKDLLGPSKDALAAYSDRLIVSGEACGIHSLSGTPLDCSERRGTSLADPALLIYTSGTTGLPKAAKVSHRRVMTWAHWFSGLMDCRADDRLYDCLPMHHSVGGVVAPGAMLVAGGALVIGKRFSAAGFWSDVAAFRCTMVQYIGELCRYLLASPPTDEELGHPLRLACGNGLSGEIWSEFQQRFGIPRILEFYASTEGNFSLFNLEGEPGALGRIPAFLAHRFPLRLVVFDDAVGEPFRDGAGHCLRCSPGEVGEAIARIGEAAPFEGYTDADASSAKVLRNVFEDGDAWLRSGDLMRQDERGFYRFVDRIGDTFRWKGENVATTEVAAALAAYQGVAAACVYGVRVAGADGRAGMAALDVGATFDLAGLAGHLKSRLPGYAVPLYLRLTDGLSLTETFKPQKALLVEQGYDPAMVDDPLFVLKNGAYVSLRASPARRARSRTAASAEAMAPDRA